jgi:hypothetical protein
MHPLVPFKCDIFMINICMCIWKIWMFVEFEKKINVIDIPTSIKGIIRRDTRDAIIRVDKDQRKWFKIFKIKSHFQPKSTHNPKNSTKKFIWPKKVKQSVYNGFLVHTLLCFARKTSGNGFTQIESKFLCRGAHTSPWDTKLPLLS